jgi:hypothetical protein
MYGRRNLFLHEREMVRGVSLYMYTEPAILKLIVLAPRGTYVKKGQKIHVKNAVAWNNLLLI